ncbi:MAG: hypothetical protein H6703_00665 [Myxococcales bacterium]|nr:hypothetical protein [Myxococcales bacterium]
MPHIDEFWDDIADEGLVDPDQAGRARARFIQVGGGLDTAVLENAPLAPEMRLRLLEIAARALDKKIADPETLSHPDAEAARHIPAAVIDRYGVMPARDEQGRLILITPPLAPHVFNELKMKLGRSFDARITFEIDLRLALARHFDVPLPARFEVLRSGRQPGRSVLSGVPARRPPPRMAQATPTPRPSTGGDARGWLARASTALRMARDEAALVDVLDRAGADVLDGRFYLVTEGDALRCVGGTGLGEGEGPSIPVTAAHRLGQALTLGSSRLEDWPADDPDLIALYDGLGRAAPARIMVEPIRDGLDVIGVFVGDHGPAGIDRTAVGAIRRWLSRVSVRLADLRGARPAPRRSAVPARLRPTSLPPLPEHRAAASSEPPAGRPPSPPIMPELPPIEPPPAVAPAAIGTTTRPRARL